MTSNSAHRANWHLPQGIVDAFDREVRTLAPGGNVACPPLPHPADMPDKAVKHLCGRLGAWTTAVLQILDDNTCPTVAVCNPSPTELWSATYTAGCHLTNQWQYPPALNKYLREEECNAPCPSPTVWGFSPAWDKQAERSTISSDRLMLGLAVLFMERAQAAAFYMCDDAAKYLPHGGAESAGQAAAQAHALLSQMVFAPLGGRPPVPDTDQAAKDDCKDELDMFRRVLTRAKSNA